MSILMVLFTMVDDKKLLAVCEICELTVGMMVVPLSQRTTIKLVFFNTICPHIVKYT